jgi:hypothetical protein
MCSWSKTSVSHLIISTLTPSTAAEEYVESMLVKSTIIMNLTLCVRRTESPQMTGEYSPSVQYEASVS